MAFETESSVAILKSVVHRFLNVDDRTLTKPSLRILKSLIGYRQKTAIEPQKKGKNVLKQIPFFIGMLLWIQNGLACPPTSQPKQCPPGAWIYIDYGVGFCQLGIEYTSPYSPPTPPLGSAGMSCQSHADCLSHFCSFSEYGGHCVGDRDESHANTGSDFNGW